MNIFQKLICWAFYKYVDTGPIINLEGFEFELDDEPDSEEDLIYEVDCLSQRLQLLMEPSFDNEIEKAMYERRFSTLH